MNLPVKNEHRSISREDTDKSQLSSMLLCHGMQVCNYYYYYCYCYYYYYYYTVRRVATFSFSQSWTGV